MADKTGISWTDATWNPTTGCDRVSPGCANCYALDLAARLKRMGQRAYQRDGDPKTSGPGFAYTEHPDRLDQPLRWTRPRRIFVNSMSDLFHEQATDEFLDRVFAVMALAPQHTFQVLTKRPERMRDYITGKGTILDGPSGIGRAHEILKHGANEMLLASKDKAWPGWPLPNVWLGTSVENQRWTSRIEPLLETPATIRFLSCEPLLGSIDLTPYVDRGHETAGPLGWVGQPSIDWVIVGGESGPEHRPVDPAWVRSLRDQCLAAGVPFWFKQWGGRTPRSGGHELDGREWYQFPATTA